MIPYRAKHQRRSCAGEREAVKARPAGAESHPEAGRDYWREVAAARGAADGGVGPGESPGRSRPRCARILPTTAGSSSRSHQLVGPSKP